jgi:hypothetical protein
VPVLHPSTANAAEAQKMIAATRNILMIPLGVVYILRQRSKISAYRT